MPHVWGQLVGLIYSSIKFWALFCWQGWPPFSKVTQHFCLVGLGNLLHPQMVSLWWEVAWGPFALALGSPWWEVIWGSPFWNPKDLDLLHQWQLEHQWLLECHWMVKWLICSILSSRIAAVNMAHWWASLTRAIISLYESHFVAVNFSYMLQLAVANSTQGSGWGALASNCLCSSSGCADGCLSQRCSLMELRISLQRHSSVASSHQPLLGSLWDWYTSQYRSSMSSWVESRQKSSVVVGSTPRSH